MHLRLTVDGARLPLRGPPRAQKRAHPAGGRAAAGQRAHTEQRVSGRSWRLGPRARLASTLTETMEDIQLWPFFSPSLLKNSTMNDMGMYQPGERGENGVLFPSLRG